MTLVEAIALIPPGFSLTCEMERASPDDEMPGALFLTACLFENAHSRHPSRVIAGVSTAPTDFEAFERLTVGMILKRFKPTPEACAIPERKPT